MQIFFLNGLWRFLKNGHIPVKLYSSAPHDFRSYCRDQISLKNYTACVYVIDFVNVNKFSTHGVILDFFDRDAHVKPFLNPQVI